MLNHTLDSAWASDLFYSTEVFPSPFRRENENSDSTRSNSRYSSTSTSPNELVSASRRSPFKDLAQSANGQLYIVQDPLIRRLNFQE